MGLTNFPYGVSSFGIPVIGAGPVFTTGKVFFVHSGTGQNANGRGTDPSRPFASIDYALGFCSAGKGDTIIVMPDHLETVIAAGGLDIDVEGVSIIGVGSGDNRPQINFTTATTADMDIDAANVTLYNLLFTGGIDALVAPIDVNAADCKILQCEFRDVTGEAVAGVIADANAHRLLIDGFFYNGAAGAGGASAIILTGMTNPVIRNFRIVGNFSAGAIECRTTAVVDLAIHDGYIWTKNSADLAIRDLITGSTGRVGPNLNFMLTDNAANITQSVTGATFQYFMPIEVNNLAGERSTEWNGTEATHA